MKPQIIYSVIIVTTILLSSCEKIIDYELNTTSPKLVIEANLTDDPDYSSVTLSKSKNFTDNNTFEPISNAIVVITDNAGNIDTLKETEPGTYKPLKISGISGRVYNLTVTSENKTYTAQSQMPNIVHFDSIGFTTVSAFGQSATFAIPYFQDPADEVNYFRFIEYVNGERSTSIFIWDDAQKNGKYNKESLRSFSDEVKIENGKPIEIVMMSVDANVYKYFYSLSQIIGDSGPDASGTPSNPLTNISGGALGYFSACTFQKKSTIYYQ